MKVLIIEDEQTAALRLQKMVTQLDPEISIAGMTDSIESTLEWLENNPRPDLILSDIQLADGSSFEIFREAVVTTPVIFTTAYDEHAISAFKFNSIDYLLKPIKLKELSESLDKFRKLKPQAPDYTQLLQILQKEQHYQQRLIIRFGHTIKTVDIDSIAYFYTQDKAAFLCTFDKKRLPIDQTLDETEKILDPTCFFRINRQYIINIKAIFKMHSYSKARVKIELNPPSDAETIVSTERAPRFKNWLTGVYEEEYNL